MCEYTVHTPIENHIVTPKCNIEKCVQHQKMLDNSRIFSDIQWRCFGKSQIHLSCKHTESSLQCTLSLCVLNEEYCDANNINYTRYELENVKDSNDANKFNEWNGRRAKLKATFNGKKREKERQRR